MCHVETEKYGEDDVPMQVMRAYGGVQLLVHSCLTWAPHVSQLHAPAALPPGKVFAGVIGSWVNPKAGLDVLEKTTVSCPCRDLNPRSFSLVMQRSYAGLEEHSGLGVFTGI